MLVKLLEDQLIDVSQNFSSYLNALVRGDETEGKIIRETGI